MFLFKTGNGLIVIGGRRAMSMIADSRKRNGDVSSGLEIELPIPMKHNCPQSQSQICTLQ
jgi:hypothetical protein